MSVELSNKSPANTNNHYPNAFNKRVSEKKRHLKNLAVEEKQKDKLPLFYTNPIFKSNKYEFY